MERPRRKDFLVFGSPDIKEAEIDEVVDTLRSGWLGTGPKVARFESMFCEYTGAQYVRALSSCTAGLELALRVAGVGPGDEVITTPMTFCATANVIIHVGARPIFVDIERESMNIDPSLAERAITPKTKAIIPVHFAGRPCNMEAIMELGRKYDLVVIEDGAHAVSAEYHGWKIGNIGDLTCFSFYVTKNVVTGEGGMITTNNREWADKIEILALHGLSAGAWERYSEAGFKHYQVVYAGYKYNMTDIQASLGIHQLARIEKNLQRREEIWQRYDEAFRDLPVTIPAPMEANTRHARHLYILILDIDQLKTSRDAILNALHREDIGTGVHYISLHLHEYYRKRYSFGENDFPNAKYVSDRTISLPLSSKLSDEDVEDVIAAVKRVLGR